jgi:hypothetical protein
MSNQESEKPSKADANQAETKYQMVLRSESDVCGWGRRVFYRRWSKEIQLEQTKKSRRKEMRMEKMRRGT